MSYVAKEWAEHQRKRWLRHDAWRFLPPHELFERKYSPDQPRVPAGSSDGGQWTDGNGSGESEGNVAQIYDEAVELFLDETLELSAAGRGHHWMPFGVTNKYDLSGEASTVFDNAVTGRLWDPRSNKWDADHIAYNDAVAEAFDRYLKDNGIDPK